MCVSPTSLYTGCAGCGSLRCPEDIPEGTDTAANRDDCTELRIDLHLSDHYIGPMCTLDCAACSRVWTLSDLDSGAEKDVTNKCPAYK